MNSLCFSIVSGIVSTSGDPTAFDTAGNMEAFLFLALFMFIVMLPFTILILVGWWKVFGKAGIPRVLAIIPIINGFYLSKAGGRPAWWGILLFIPIIGIFINIIICIGIAERFKRGGGTVVGLVLLPFIFYPILGFGSAQWTAPARSA